MAARNTTYKYRFMVDGEVVHYGITTDLERREREHRVRWPEGHIEKVGRRTTHEAAWRWDRQQNGRSFNPAY